MENFIQIVHCKEQPYTVYIGRPGPYGNPIAIGKDCPICKKIHRTRGATLPCYKIWFYDENQKTLREQIKQNIKEGDILGCWCKSLAYPHRECHGDVIVDFLMNKNTDFSQSEGINKYSLD